MKFIEQSWNWVQKPSYPLETIEKAGRVCYQSESELTKETAHKFVRMLVKHAHESVIEHVSASVRFVTNRGVTHEMVRHRLCSFSQESTRYVKYGDDMEFIKPVWWDDWTLKQKLFFQDGCSGSCYAYNQLIKSGTSPQQAREVLPNSIKTELVMTTNLREWRHVFKLRTSLAAHPQMRALMLDCLAGFKDLVPILFADI